MAIVCEILNDEVSKTNRLEPLPTTPRELLGKKEMRPGEKPENPILRCSVLLEVLSTLTTPAGTNGHPV